MLQTQLAILCTHSMLTPGQPFQALTPHRPAPGRVGTTLSMVRGIPWTDRVGTTVSMDWQGRYYSVHGLAG